MKGQTSPSRTLMVAGIILLFLIIIAALAALLTRRISQRVANQSRSASPRSVTPTPRERAIYLDLPASFPRDIPLPDEAKVIVGSEDAAQWDASLTTFLTLEEVERFYAVHLSQTGWTITNQSRAAGLTTFYTRKGKRDAIIFFGKGDSGITISITILKNP